MNHNEISAMYRGVLEAVGYKNLSVLTTEGAFWDKRIYHYASLTRDNSLLSEEEVRLRLLVDLAYGLVLRMKELGISIAPYYKQQRRQR